MLWTIIVCWLYLYIFNFIFSIEDCFLQLWSKPAILHIFVNCMKNWCIVNFGGVKLKQTTEGVLDSPGMEDNSVLRTII